MRWPHIKIANLNIAIGPTWGKIENVAKNVPNLGILPDFFGS